MVCLLELLLHSFWCRDYRCLLFEKAVQTKRTGTAGLVTIQRPFDLKLPKKKRLYAKKHLMAMPFSNEARC